jgi:thioredoxin reductase (NADPH)
MALGGQIVLSPNIENFPGFPGGIATMELVERIKKQVDALGVEIKFDEVIKINAQEKGFFLEAKEQSYQAGAVIIASGARSKHLGVSGEDRLIGRGVSYCGTCDGPLFKNKEIVTVGAGDRAIEEAIFLSNYASKVTIVHRRQGLRASQILQEQLRKNPRINFLLDSVVEEIIGQVKVEGVKIRNIRNNSLSQLVCQGVFIFVGISPNTDFLKNYLELDAAGFIITPQSMHTSQPGIFACGDCRQKNLYQVVNACAEGAEAADSAHKYLLNKDK